MNNKPEHIQFLKEKLRENPWYVTFYYVSFMLLLASVPLSKFTTSVFQFFVAGSWATISALHYSEKIGTGSFITTLTHFFRNVFLSLIKNFKSFFSNTSALILTSIYLIQVIGMIWTSDINSGVYKLRTQLPLLILPIIIST